MCRNIRIKFLSWAYTRERDRQTDRQTDRQRQRQGGFRVIAIARPII